MWTISIDARVVIAVAFLVFAYKMFKLVFDAYK